MYTLNYILWFLSHTHTHTHMYTHMYTHTHTHTHTHTPQEFYPCNDKEKLNELAETCQLMSIVVEFQQQVCVCVFVCMRACVYGAPAAE